MRFASGRPTQPSPKESPRAADTAEGTTDRSEAMPVIPTIAPPTRISEETMDAWGVDPVHRIAGCVEDARNDLMDAMALADRKGLTELHRQIAERVLAVDDLQALLTDWSGDV